eukprot:847321_1
MSPPLPGKAPLPTGAPIPTGAAAPLTAHISALAGPVSAPVALAAPPILTSGANDATLTLHRPTIKMRHFPWKPLKKKTDLKDTMFEHVQINEEEIRLDLKLLQRLWCKSTTNRPVSELKSPSTIFDMVDKKTKRFVSDIASGKVTLPMRIISLVLFKYNAMTFNSVITDIKHVEEIHDMDYIEKLLRMVPNAEQLAQFKAHPKITALAAIKDDAQCNRMVNKFPYLERVWYRCIQIPNVYTRCKARLLCLEAEEFCPFHSENIQSLHALCVALQNDTKLPKILELVLCIGNFLNDGHRKLGNAKGFALTALHHMKFLRSNQDQKYSLLLYLVDLVNAYYPELSDWVDVLTLKRIDLLLLVNGFQHIQGKIASFRQRYLLGQHQLFRQRYLLDKADNDITQVYGQFQNTLVECQGICKYLCHTQNPVAQDWLVFYDILLDIKSDWLSAQQLTERAKNIFIALICGYIREMEAKIVMEIPSFIIWWIYVYFPRWSLMSIAKFLELNVYQFNQYIEVPNRLPYNQQGLMQGLHLRPSRQMKPLHWRWSKRLNANNTIFANMDRNHADVYLDYPLLEALWCKHPPPITNITNRSKSRKRRPTAKINRKMFAIIDDVLTPNRGMSILVLSRVLFKGNVTGLRDVILDCERINDLEYARKIHRVVPTNGEMEAFRNTTQIQRALVNVDQVKKFPFLEQLWFYCLNIPHMSKRCELQVLRLEVEEFIPEQYENVRLLQKIYGTLHNNAQLLKMAELVLFMGNYFYFGHQRLGGAKGFVWNVFDELNTCRANHDDQYSLLMYLVEMMQTYYPSLLHWVNVFDVVEERRRKRIDEDAILYEMNSFKDAVDNESVQRFLKMRRKLDTSDSTEGDAVQKQMKKTLDDIRGKLNALDSDFSESLANCNTLVRYFGFHHRGCNFNDLCEMLVAIRSNWDMLQVKMEKPIQIYNTIVVAYCRKFAMMNENEIGLEVIEAIYLYLPQSFKAYLLQKFAQDRYVERQKIRTDVFIG